MSWLTVFQLTLVFSPAILNEYVPTEHPVGLSCMRKHSESLWWDHFFESNPRCEELNNEECGVCGISFFTKKGTNSCHHIALLWKYNWLYRQIGKNLYEQYCAMMDHCNNTYAMRRVEQSKEENKIKYINLVCGQENEKGEREKRGECKSVFGTYICECRRGYQGRDCNDVGPKSDYAHGVQVLLNTKVRVANPMTILIAVKERGNNIKVHVTLFQLNNVGPSMTITEEVITDPSSEKLVKYCRDHTELNEQCNIYLKGSTYMYSIKLKFPLIRDSRFIYYYKENQDESTPIGYFTNFTVTTTNTVDGIEKESFWRTNYDRAYNVFVQYPRDTGCYRNPEITNCKELQDKVNIYDASREIVLQGKLIEKKMVAEVAKLQCNENGDKTTKWTIFQLLPNGTYFAIDGYSGISEFQFVINPYTLRNGIYMLEFEYSLTTTNFEMNNFDQCFFKVVESPLIAIIDGGRSRYVDVDSVIVLDGSRSGDPNIEVKRNKEGLNFEWSCITNETNQACLESYISRTDLHVIKLPKTVLEPQKIYIIKLKVTKLGKEPAYALQTLVAGRQEKFESIVISCINCKEGNTANPTDYIYLLVEVVLKPNVSFEFPLNFTWTFSIAPVTGLCFPETSTASIRVNQTSQDLLKIDKNKLEQNNTYCFRAAVQENKTVYAEINIHISILKNFTCSLTPDSGIVAVTNFSLNCSKTSNLILEVYDKSSSDPNYYSGRMLFTNNFDESFKLAHTHIVVYGYNSYKEIQEWTQEVELANFSGQSKDIDDMVQNLKYISATNNQTRLHSASVIPGALTPGMDLSSIMLLHRLISFIYQVKFRAFQDVKLVLSSLESILVVVFKNEQRKNFKLEVEEAKMCADIISALASTLFERVKLFDDQVTLTELILQQMITSHLNVIKIVLAVKNAKILSKPLYLVNPYVLQVVKDTTYKLVNALYKLSSCLLYRQIQGDSATEIFSSDSKIIQWAMVNYPKELYHLRRQDESILFNFSFGFYQIMQNLKVLGIQVTNLNINPFWWAGGDINTNILLVDICFKTNPTRCKYQRTFYKAPIFLYFNISQTYNSITPLDIYTVYLNRSKSSYDLDLDITVYRFDPPIRAKLFIQFEFENSTENYKVVFSVNKRPDIGMMEKGVTINNENQKTKQFLKYIRNDKDKLYYMGIIPANNGSAGQKSKIKLKIVYAVCKTWLRWKWGNQRCWVGEEETNDRTLRCDCNHLSMFAAAVQVPSYTLNPAMEFLLFLTEEFNWLPLIVLIIIFLIFLILYVWGWRKDRKDLMKGFVMVLEDNYPGERFAYLIGVYTGSRINSSTDANVGIKLFGGNDVSRAHILKSDNRPTLQGNSDDWFLIYNPVHLGTLQSLHIWHDNSGKSPDWFIEKVEVYDLTDKFEYIFELNIWLALGVNEYPDAVVATSSMQDFYSVRGVFLSNVITGFRDTNYWTSIFWKHARNPVARVQRVSVVLCYIMVAMICTIIFYHFNKGEEYKEDEPSYELNYTDFIIFIITLLVASFTTCLVMYLFRKSFSHKHVRMQSSLFIRPEVKKKGNSEFYSMKQTVSHEDTSKNLSKLSIVSLYDSSKPRFIELSSKNLDEKSISLGLRGKLPRERSMYENFAAAVHAIVRGSTLQPVRLPKYKSNVILHKKYLITAWTLLIVFIILATAVVILFGHRISKVEGEKWITIFLCILLFDALVLSTLKILLCSLILGCVFQRLVPASNFQIKPEDGMRRNLVGDMNHLYFLAQIRSHPMYCPLNEKLKEIYRQKCVRKDQWKILIDFLVVLLLLLVLVMLTSLFTMSLYNSNAHAASMLTKGPSLNYKNFTNIYNRTLFSEFLLNNFLYQLHRYLWYNQDSPIGYNEDSIRKSWTYDCTMRLLGNARIRQLRVILGECPDVKLFEDIEEFCSPPWSPGVQDTGTYSSRWYIGGSEDLRRKSSAWRYTDTSHSNSSVSYGITLTKYPSGGFIGDLGFEKDDTEGALASLFPQHWLDSATRAVFVELTLYNANTRLFTQVVLIAEQMPTGEYLVDVKAVSVTTDFTFDIWKLSFSIFLIFLLVRMCVLMNRRGIFVYFSKIINLFEGFLLALGFLTLFFYLIHITSSSEYAQEFQRRGIYEFFNFSNLISYFFWSRTALCILFVCVVLRMIISFRFGRIYFTFYYTLILSMPWIIWLVLYFILYILVIRRFIGYLFNSFIFSYYTSVIIYYKDFSASLSENFSYKILVYLICLSSYVVILMFIASFAYYYKVAKVYNVINTDNLNFFIFLKEIIVSRRKNK